MSRRRIRIQIRLTPLLTRSPHPRSLKRGGGLRDILYAAQAGAQAEAGQGDAALRTANRIGQTDLRSLTTGVTALTFLQRGEEEKALQAALRVDDPGMQAFALSAIAEDFRLDRSPYAFSPATMLTLAALYQAAESDEIQKIMQAVQGFDSKPLRTLAYTLLTLLPEHNFSLLRGLATLETDKDPHLRSIGSASKQALIKPDSKESLASRVLTHLATTPQSELRDSIALLLAVKLASDARYDSAAQSALQTRLDSLPDEALRNAVATPLVLFADSTKDQAELELTDPALRDLRLIKHLFTGDTEEEIGTSSQMERYLFRITQPLMRDYLRFLFGLIAAEMDDQSAMAVNANRFHSSGMGQLYRFISETGHLRLDKQKDNKAAPTLDRIEGYLRSLDQPHLRNAAGFVFALDSKSEPERARILDHIENPLVKDFARFSARLRAAEQDTDLNKLFASSRPMMQDLFEGIALATAPEQRDAKHPPDPQFRDAFTGSLFHALHGEREAMLASLPNEQNPDLADAGLAILALSERDRFGETRALETAGRIRNPLTRDMTVSGCKPALHLIHAMASAPTSPC